MKSIIGKTFVKNVNGDYCFRKIESAYYSAVTGEPIRYYIATLTTLFKNGTTSKGKTDFLHADTFDKKVLSNDWKEFNL